MRVLLLPFLVEFVEMVFSLEQKYIILVLCTLLCSLAVLPVWYTWSWWIPSILLHFSLLCKPVTICSDNGSHFWVADRILHKEFKLLNLGNIADFLL